MGLRSLIRGVRRALTVQSVIDRLARSKEDGMQAFKTALFALAGAIAVSVVAQVTAACPDLTSQAAVILTGTIGGGIAFLINRPRSGAAGKSVLAGAGAAALAAGLEQIRAACGADFIQQLPTLATAGLWAGLGLYLRSPREAVPAPRVE